MNGSSLFMNNFDAFVAARSAVIHYFFSCD
jgi:hypothetical protein